MQSEIDEEIQALEAIYDDAFTIIDNINKFVTIDSVFYYGRVYSISVQDQKQNSACVEVRLPDNYPGSAEAVLNVSAPFLTRDQLKHVMYGAQSIAKAGIGAPVIYDTVEYIRDRLIKFSERSFQAECAEIVHSDEKEHVANDQFHLQSVKFHLNRLPERAPFAQNVRLNHVYHGDCVEDRKSIFQAHCMRCESELEVSAFISEMLRDRKVAEATHNILAWCIPRTASSPPCNGCDDDGEHQAGKGLLRFIELSGASFVVVMVSRWFGGTLLGPDRFRHINGAAKQVLSDHGFIEKKQNKKKR